MVLKKVTINIRGRYQKLIATKGEAISTVLSSKPTAIACVARAGRRFTKRVVMSMIERKIIKIFAEKTELCLEFEYAGIKTCVNAPSAKKRRNRYGSLNATKKMSLYMFAPSADAVSKSLKNPKILETKIPKLLVKIALNMGFFRDLL